MYIATCSYIASYCIYTHIMQYIMYFCVVCIHCRQLASQLSGIPREPPCYNSSTVDNACPLKTEEILARLSLQYKLLPSWTVPSYRYCL